MDRVTRGVELTLNRYQASVFIGRNSHQINASITSLALRPLTPQVNLFELVSKTRIVKQKLARELLKHGALFTFTSCQSTVLI